MTHNLDEGIVLASIIAKNRDGFEKKIKLKSKAVENISVVYDAAIIRRDIYGQHIGS